MKHKILGSFFIGTVETFLTSCDLFDNKSGIPINENIWVKAYLVSWQHNPETELINSGIIKTSDIDWELSSEFSQNGSLKNPLLGVVKSHKKYSLH